MSALTVPGRGEFGRLFGARARTFSFASRFLPPERRRAVEALYAFCRTVDDLADEYPLAVGGPLLDAWWQWVDGLQRGESRPVPAPAPDRPEDENRVLTAALLEVVQRFGVPPAYLRLLVEGVRSDTERAAIASFPELRDYCYRVAGTVGLAMCHVLGAATPEAYERAERLGIAMQLTNVLRDVGEDLQKGRVYLPADDLTRFAGVRAGPGHAPRLAALRGLDAVRGGAGADVLRRRHAGGVPAAPGEPPADPDRRAPLPGHPGADRGPGVRRLLPPRRHLGDAEGPGGGAGLPHLARRALVPAG